MPNNKDDFNYEDFVNQELDKNNNDQAGGKAAVEDIKSILKYMSKGFKLPAIIVDTIREVAKKEIEEKEKIVVIKRDPNIHTGRMQAVYPVITDGKTVEIHPSIVGPMGADFDGDTVSIFLPLSEETQKEAKKQMITAKAKYSTNVPQYGISQEALAGLYTLTDERSTSTTYIKVKDITTLREYHPGTPVEVTLKGKSIKTTAGRAIFNSILPPYMPFYDEPIGKKQVGNILSAVLNKNEKDHYYVLDTMIKLGFEMATRYPRTFSLDMFTLSPKLVQLKKDLSKEKDISKQMDIVDAMEKELLSHLEKTNRGLYQIIKSGAAKGTNQIRQMLVSKGLIADPKGNIMPPIIDSIGDGYTPQEYFDAAAGARKGIADRALNTAKGGYAYRKILFILSDVEADINNPDCGTKRTLNIILTKDMYNRMRGRYVVDERGGVRPISADMISTHVRLRTPIYCRSKKICRKCYGDLLTNINTRNVGVVAAGEVGSLAEKIMKSSVGVVHYNDKLYSFDDLWELADKLETKNE